MKFMSRMKMQDPIDRWIIAGIVALWALAILIILLDH